MTVAMAQTMYVPGDVEANIARIEATCREAAERGVTLVVFAEVALTGSLQRLLDGRTPYDHATRVPGPETDRLEAVCREHDLSIVVGTVEAGDDRRLYKTAFVVTPDGYLGKYRKYQPAPVERDVIAPGDDLPVFDISGWSLAIGVCWDLYFPELPQLYALKGAEIYVVPSGDNAFPIDSAQHGNEKSAFNLAGFKRIGPARACDNGMYVLIAVDANSAGGSVAFDPAGEQIAYGGSGEELICMELRRDLLEAARPGFTPYLRPWIFRRLAEATEDL